MRSSHAILFIFLSLAAVNAQPKADWGRVRAVPVNTKIVVETKAGSSIGGNLREASDTELSLLKNGRTVNLRSDQIAAVYLQKRRSIPLIAIIGALAGAGAGVIAGTVYTAATRTNGLAAAAGLIYGVPIGAAIAVASVSKTKKGPLIYRAR